jgi:hypothetical protein
MSFITPAPFRSHNNLLLQYHGLARGPYRTTIRRPLEGIHTQAFCIWALDLDPGSLVSACEYLARWQVTV